MIEGGEIRVDPEKIATIRQLPIPTSVTEVGSFMGASQYLRKFIIKFSKTATPLHAWTVNGKFFQWGKHNKEHLKI
jgi:hypothetical protein